MPDSINRLRDARSASVFFLACAPANPASTFRNPRSLPSATMLNSVPVPLDRSSILDSHSIFPFREKSLRVLFAIILPIIILTYIKQAIEINFFVLILIGFLFLFSYFFILLITKSLDKKDLMIIENIKNKVTKK